MYRRRKKKYKFSNKIFLKKNNDKDTKNRLEKTVKKKKLTKNGKRIPMLRVQGTVRVRIIYDALPVASKVPKITT